ncbi:hypothetical protein Tco_0343105 [Tanacetum coccineum]
MLLCISFFLTIAKSDREDIGGLKTCSVYFWLLDGSTDQGMVDLSAFLVDSLPASSLVDPTKLMGFVPLVDALLLSNPKPILQLGNGYSLKDKNPAKTDKTEHGNGKSAKRQNNQDRDLVLRRKKEKSLDYNNSFLSEYECSSLALDKEERRDEKEEFGSLKSRSNNVSDQKIGKGDDKEFVVMGEVGEVLLGGGDSEEDMIVIRRSEEFRREKEVMCEEDE